MTATFPELEFEAWRSADIGAEVLGAPSGHLVVTQRGARAVPFDERGRPLLWLAPAVRPDAAGARAAASALSEWAAGSAWNFGAERLWIGPELRLMVEDRTDFHGSYHLPTALDPGSWELRAHDRAGETRALELQQVMTVPVHQPSAHLSLVVEQRLALEADPARRWPEARDVRHLGWSREVTLRRTPDDDGSVACQSWVVAQVEAPATVLVPGAGTARVTDYFEPVDAAHLQRRGTDLTIALTGRQRFKVGIATAEHRSLMACWRNLPDGEAALFVRYFYDAPSSRYLEQPPGVPGHEGDSLYSYNDDGRMGNFGEIEALGRALEPGAAAVSDRFELHAWWGERGRLRQLAVRLLGMDPTQDREREGQR